MSPKPVDRIRGADRIVESTARPRIDDASDWDVANGDESMAVGGLSEPEAATFERQTPEARTAPMPRNTIVVLAEGDRNLVPNVDVLEALLYLADPEGECRQMAEHALRMFGSVGAVLSARVPDLTSKVGMPRDIAYALKAIHTGMRSVLKEPIRERSHIGSFTQLIDYLGFSLKHETVEVLRILYLGRINGLISDEEPHRGTVDHVPIYPREIVKRALELGASAVIMAHNHPSGDPTPSVADVSFSQQVERALSTMDIALHDSLIIAQKGYTSLRSSGQL